MNAAGKTLAVATCSAAVLLAAACGSGPAPLTTACKTALANEKTVVGGNNTAAAAAGTVTAALPKLERQDQRALRAVTAACPGTAKVQLVMPT